MTKTLSTLCLLFFILPIGLKAQVAYEIVVAQDGSGDFITIQEAIDATKSFPDKRITIHIKNGIYNEKVRVYSWNNLLTLKGESTESTIITFDDSFKKINKGRNSTFHTYTLKVEANDFIAENLTIINSSGPVGQAVALHVEGDRCTFINCRILGHQDTLYTAGEGRRQYFRDCYIEGTTDFIFGEATVVFNNCEIHSKSNSYITAASTPEGIPFGFVFLGCKLTADSEVDKVYLGRPWRDYAKVVFVNCKMESPIAPERWSNWSKTRRDQTAYYAEFNNSGSGSDLAQKVVWAKILNEKEAKSYTVENIFKAINNTMDGKGYWRPE